MNAITKTMTTLGLMALAQTALSAPNTFQSNDRPDILVGGLSVETGTHSGPVLNGNSTVYAKNARSYADGLCRFKVNFLIHNDSAINPEKPFVTTMTYNNILANNQLTSLPASNIKNLEWLVELRPGNNTIEVRADQQNVIIESDETNNRLIKRIKVIGQCAPQQIKQPVNQRLEVNPTANQQAKENCRYDPNSARLPCSEKRKPTMKTINPFE